MNRVPLGRTGIQVSRLCYGAMSFGGDADRAESARLYAACRDAGINFFDCANVYSKGLAEEILGEQIRGHRDEVVVTSKCGVKMTADPNSGGASRRNIVASVEASLTRLGTDRLDVYFIHMWDPATPVEETLRALESLVASGKVLHVGVSNWAAWQIARGLGIAERNGWARIDVIQPMYNLVKRQAEVEILPLAQAEGLGVISYSPMGGGLLSGKYAADRSAAGRLTANQMYARRYGEAWVYETAGAFVELAAQEGVHPATLAVAWAAAHPGITCPIVGARSVEQLRPSLAAAELELSPDLYERISALSRAPALATDRREEAV